MWAMAHLEPVNGAAVDKGWILAQALPKGTSNGAEAEHHMQVRTAGLGEVCPLLHWGLGSLCQGR